tara:strand:+ start:771 stop:935 length:165 start_codon:yes stop_codon:yes gene_type:complete
MTITHDNDSPFKGYDEEKAEKRLKVIGQNGNTGEGYHNSKCRCNECKCNEKLNK